MTKDTVTLYRAVGAAEAADIRERKMQYRIAGNSAEAGKYFFLSQEDAQAMVVRGWATEVTSGEFPPQAIRDATPLSLPTEGPSLFIPARYFPFGPVQFVDDSQ